MIISYVDPELLTEKSINILKRFLQNTSKFLRNEGEPASPGQLAAILLEDKINEIIAHKEQSFRGRTTVSR